MARRKKKYDIQKDNSLTGKEKAVIYIRVSSMNQVNTGNGLESQEKLCREWAGHNHVEIVKTFSDGGVSGKLSSREALDGMIEFLGKENSKYTKIHFVVIDDMDRIMRDVQGWREVKNKIMVNGAKIYSLKQQIEETPEGVLNQNMVMSFKQYERENNARRVRERQRARMLDGYRPLYPPPGYEYINGPTGGRILQLSSDASVIKEGLELFGRGILTTQEKLKAFFNQKLFQTRRGSEVYLSFVQRLLGKNRLLFYTGHINYPDWDVNMISAKHPPIIDIVLMNKILEKLNPTTFYKKCTESEIGKKLPLRGFLIDEESNVYYSGGPSKGKNKLYFYYSCRLKDEKGKTKTINVMHDNVHTTFASYLDTFRIDEDTLELFEDVMIDTWGKKNKLKTALVSDKEKKISEIDKEVDDFMSKIQRTNKQPMIELYENKIIALTEKKKGLQLKMEESSSEQNVNIQKLISNTKAILMNPRFIWDLDNLTLQRMLIGILFNNKIYFNKKTGFQTPEIPLIYTDLRSFDLQNTHLVEMMGFEPMSKRHI